MPPVPAQHLYYIATGAGASTFTLAPECRRLAGFDPSQPDVAEVHADAVVMMLFGAWSASGPGSS